MALTPPLFALWRWRFGKAPPRATSADAIDERNPVLIAGFGRFGHIVGRLLRAHGIAATVLDNDPAHVQLLRRLGLRVFYGDAARLDLLQAAGAAQARLVVAALDDPEQNLHLVRQLRQHFPHVPVMARAHGRDASYELMDEGLVHIYRETLDSALRLSVDALQLLGVRRHRAERSARLFRDYDERTLREMAAIRHDERLYLSHARQNIADLEALLEHDTTLRGALDDGAWEAEPRRAPPPPSAGN